MEPGTILAAIDAGRQWSEVWGKRAQTITDPTAWYLDWETRSREAGSTAGRLLAMMGTNICTEQRMLVADARTASEYFTRQLPSRMAELVGWERQP